VHYAMRTPGQRGRCGCGFSTRIRCNGNRASADFSGSGQWLWTSGANIRQSLLARINALLDDEDGEAATNTLGRAPRSS
jgi:hypothetical protein